MKKIFIDVLEKELNKRNLTMNKLAKAAGIAQPTTTRWKNGSVPNADALIKICKYLNVSADYLLELEPPDPPPQNLNEKEKLIIKYYRAADERGKEYIFDAAEKEASRAAPNETKSLNSKIG